MYKKIKISLVALVFGLLFLGTTHLATENNLNFTPTINATEQKMDDSKTDIKLKAKAGGKAEISVSVKNESDKSIQIKAVLKDAATNNQGIVNYASEQRVLNKALSLEKLANYQETFELKAGEEKEIKLSIPMPKESFSGILLGGLYLQQAANEKDSHMIKNTFSYTIPVVIVESEEAVDADLRFKQVIPELSGGRNALKVTLDNPISHLLSGAKYTVNVTKKGREKVLYQGQIDQVDFAPNNSFSYNLMMGKEAYKAGDYTAHIRVKSEYGNWSWDEDFTIEQTVAKALNQKSVSTPKMSTAMKIILTLVSLMLVVMVVLIVYLRKKLKNQTQINQSHSGQK